MTRRLMRLPLLLGAIATGVGGCSFLPLKAHTAVAESVAGHPDEFLPPTDSAPPATAPSADDQLAANPLPPVCPPSDTGYRVRDLTRPWWDRVYLLPDGATCRPAGAER